MTLLKSLSDSCSAFLRKMGKLKTKGRAELPFLQLVSLEQSLAIASGLRMNFIR